METVDNQQATNSGERQYSFLHIKDLNKLFNTTQLNDLVQDWLDDQAYQLKTDAQTKMEDLESEIREWRRKFNEQEQELQAQKTSSANFELELREVREQNERLQQERDNEIKKAAQLSADVTRISAEKEDLQGELDAMRKRLKEATAANVEISSNERYQTRISQLEKEAEENKVNWASQATFALKRFEERYGAALSGKTEAAATIEETATPTNQSQVEKQVEESDQRPFPEATGNGSGAKPVDLGVSEEDRALAGAAASGSAPVPNGYQEFMASFEQWRETMNSWKEDMSSWRQNETNWRISAEKKLEQHGIVIQ